MTQSELIKKTNRNAMIIAFIGGIMMLVGGMHGAMVMSEIEDFVTENIADNAVIQMMFTILIFLAALGGIIVIIGGIFLYRGNRGTGRFLIIIGTGFGVIGWVAKLAVDPIVELFLTIGAIGVVLSLLAAVIAKKSKKRTKATLTKGK